MSHSSSCLPTKGELIRTRIATILSIAALCLFALMMTYLTISAFAGTTDMNTDNAAAENVEFMKDPFFLNVIWFILFTIAVLGLSRLMRSFNLHRVRLLLFIFIVFTGFIWVLSAMSMPTHDSYIVSEAAYKASIGNYEPLKNDYFRRFPFQLGYVRFAETMTKIFRLGDWYLGIELVNVLFLAIAYDALLHFLELVFKEKQIVRICAVLMALCIPPILFCTFTYGNIPSLSLGCVALWQFALAVKEPDESANSKKEILFTCIHVAIGAIALGYSVSIKLNSLIFFVAMVIVLLLRILRTPQIRVSWKPLACIAFSLLFVWSVPAAVKSQYESRADVKFGEGIPMASWAAMGLNEAYIAPGWYSSEYTVGNFRKNNYDPNAASKASMVEIHKRLEKFKEEPQYAVTFFDQKVRSQWNEPSYQSIWTNQVRGEYADKAPLGKWVCEDGEYTVKGFMNVFQQSVFLLSLIGCIWLVIDLIRSKGQPTTFMGCEGIVLPVIVIGGILYHLIFEAKSQYGLTYFVLLLPVSAYAGWKLYQVLTARLIPLIISKVKTKSHRP